MDDQVTPRQFVVFLFALLSGGVLASMYWYWAFDGGPAAWLIGAARIVKRLFTIPSVVMSRAQDERPSIAASSLQTDARQTPDRPMIAKPTPEQWLTLYQLMRAHGIKRDEAGAAFRAAGLTLDNNAWAKAQPPEAVVDGPAHITPIAGRQTDAEFPYEELIR